MYTQHLPKRKKKHRKLDNTKGTEQRQNLPNNRAIMETSLENVTKDVNEFQIMITLT